MKNNLLQISIRLGLMMLLIGCTAVSEDDLMDATPIPEILTYNENVKEAVENRNLIGRISSDDPSFLMPVGGPRLPQNLIDIIIQWNADGLIEE
ncbi:hypothetical protein [Aequorivita marina]|uniref:hypothetical protein n=1 Tax=Aequorivita marina TaxID=3073654 RepID=UPI002875CF9E|nr:hypothetical protein [Aequorivita sp. S2608]MDS1298137.1 hypothetical protein [Aequorivita sp. S2608]